jgi:hypothetical protein
MNEFFLEFLEKEPRDVFFPIQIFVRILSLNKKIFLINIKYNTIVHNSFALSINHYRFLLVEITPWDNSIKGLKLTKAFYMNELFLNYFSVIFS